MNAALTEERARADLDGARERQTAVTGELAALRAQLEEVARQIAEVTTEGDSGGKVRGLTAEARGLRERVEDVAADALAQAAAVDGANRRWHAARLDALAAEWSESGPTRTALAERFRAEVHALKGVLDELAASEAEQSAAQDTCRHVVNTILGGAHVAPNFPGPELGVPLAEVRSLGASVDRVLQYTERR